MRHTLKNTQEFAVEYDMTIQCIDDMYVINYQEKEIGRILRSKGMFRLNFFLWMLIDWHLSPKEKL